jgi:hypothetical protein
MLVVLPAPFTPAIIITSGWARPSIRDFSSGLSRPTNKVRSAALTCCGSVSRSARTFSRSDSSRNSVASTPASDISRAVSSSSYRSSSILAPMKIPVRFELVFDRPLFRRVSQDFFAAASGAGGGTISTVSSAPSAKGAACEGVSGVLRAKVVCAPLVAAGIGMAGAVGAAGLAATAPAGWIARCEVSTGERGAADSGAVCDSSSVAVASGSFEPLNRLKKLNMIWRGESERRCAAGWARRQRQAARQCGMQGAGSRSFYQAHVSVPPNLRLHAWPRGEVENWRPRGVLAVQPG